jgi:tRNA-5-taurinomethyluridine 2-sulfurtransferase
MQGRRKIAVLISGGVDSSVALHLLHAQGYDVTAFYIKIWLEDEFSYLGSCPWQEDLTYVTALCNTLAIPLEIVSLQKEYYEHIVAYTINELRQGNTPNPDILCNTHIKFGLFLTKIAPHFTMLATGHYAQIIERLGQIHLYASPDPIKDQSYFLAQLDLEQLKRALFPIGHMTKTMVRAYAQSYDLPSKNRKDSQGICFLGSFKFHDFIKQYLGSREGALVEQETGLFMGTHEGYWFYTIGQRQGLGLAGGPWYVVAKDISTNTIFISRNYYADTATLKHFFIRTASWISITTP